MGHSNSLAFYLNLVLAFALALYVCGEGRWKTLGGWTLGCGFLALLCTQSLGGLLAFLAILVLAIFCFVRSSKKRLALLALLCALVCLFYFLRSILNPTHTEEILGSDTLTRLALWSTAWDEFVHFPVLGVGWGNFAAQFGFDIPSMAGISETHNIYLQLLAETGLVGLIAFFNLVVQSWRQARRQLRSSTDFLDLAIAFGVLGAFLSLLVHGFVDIPFFAQHGTLLWVFLALLVVSDRLQRETKSGPMPRALHV
jgi:putative inorganic carbon (HCO3(-)) transporter